MGNELISIIVPIFNVENYLRECLDSIHHQTYENFECLLIDDGSPDNSAEICREYVAKDSRFRYFKKENGGLSTARNFGIEVANGDFVVFVDGDDIIDRHQLGFLHDKLKEYDADIAIGSYHQYSEKDGCFYIHFTDEDYAEQLYERDELIMKFRNWKKLIYHL